MVAQPIKRKLLADIKEAGGWDNVFERIASGETQTAIAKGFGVSQGFLSRILNQDEERRRAFREAKKQAGSVYADQALQIVDDAPPERDAIQKARAQADVRKWLSSAWDRELYGEAGPDVHVNVLSMAQLHLDALRHRVADVPRKLPAPEHSRIAPPLEDTPMDPPAQ